jgi:hypothetical protein
MTTPSGQPVSQPVSGIQVLIGATGTTPTDAIAGLRKLDGLPESTVKTYETTSIDAQNSDLTADMSMYFGFGKIDEGELSFTVGMIESRVSQLYSLRGVPKAWRTLFPSSSHADFNGAITKIKTLAPAGEEVTFAVTVKLSGPLVFTTASAATPVVIEALVTETATHHGTSYDLGATYAPSLPGNGMEASIQISAIDRTTGDESYSFQLEQSSDNATFTACGPAVSTTVVGTIKVAGVVSLRYVRVTATLGGTTPSATYVTTLSDLIY